MRQGVHVGKFRSKLLVGVLLLALTGTVLWHFVPVWAAQPIVVNPITDQSATENVSFNFSFGAGAFVDPDGDVLTYASQLQGGSALPAWLSFDSATRTFSGTPSNGDVGVIAVEVIASDGSESVSDLFDITIYDEANAPSGPIVVNPIPNQNATEDAAFNFQFAADTFEDGAQTLTYFAQSAGGTALPAWLSFDGATRTLSGTPSNGDTGTLSIDMLADNGSGGVATDTFDIIVANTNDAPIVANAVPNQNATEDSVFNFQFASNTFNDVDVGDTLTYSAQLNGGGALPAWLSFNAATRTFSGVPVNSNVGTISIDVTADDGNGGTVTDTFNIVVTNSNDSPVIANAIPNQNTTEDTAFNFQFTSNTFNDADVGDNLTYSAQLAGGGLLPTWLSFDALTRTFSGTPSNGDVGTISIDVIADDSNGGTVTDTFDIVVAEASEGPSVTLPPTMIAPVSNTTYGLIPVNYELGEDPLTGSVKLIFVGSQTITITPDIGSSATGPYDYTINPTDITAAGALILSTSQNTVPDGVYTVVLSYQNSNGDPAASVVATNVTINAAMIDTDSDGSLDSVEQAGPNNGDANGDDTADSEQANVYSYLNPISSNYAVLETNCERIENFQIGSESSQLPDPDYDYPMGLASFWIHCENAGDTARIRHYYYGVEGSELYSVRKWMNDGTYREITGYQPLGALVGDNVIFMTQYEIKDGGVFDDDGTQDAVVRDPSGAALRVAQATTPVADTNSNVNQSSALANTGTNTVTSLIAALALIGTSTFTLAFFVSRKLCGTAGSKS